MYLFTNPGQINIGGALTSQELAFVQNLEGLSYATGDILYYDGANLNRLAIGTAGQILTVSGGLPSWAASASGGATQLSELSDVNTSTPTNRNALVADGVDFESRALEAADIQSGTFDDARISQSSVTQHQAALSITESQISDLQSYLLPSDIGSTVQAFDAGLQSIAGLTTLADRMIYTTASDTYAVTTLTSFARTLLDDTTALAARTTLGVAIGSDVQAWSSVLDNTTASFTTADETKLDGIATGAIANVVEDTTPQLGGELDAQDNSIGFTMQTATGDGTTTIDWGNGNHMDFTFGAFNETFTFTAPAKPCVLTLSLKQDSVGSRTATWPASVKWPGGTAPTLTTTATTGYDIISFRYDGTNYYGVSTLNFS